MNVGYKVSLSQLKLLELSVAGTKCHSIIIKPKKKKKCEHVFRAKC